MGELRKMASGAAREAEVQLEADATRDAEIGQEKIAYERMNKTGKRKFEERSG